MKKINKKFLLIVSVLILTGVLLTQPAYAQESPFGFNQNEDTSCGDILFGPVLDGDNYTILDNNPLSRMAGSWVQRNGFWYFYATGGRRLANEWMRDAQGRWFWFHSTGRMATEWVEVTAGRWFFFNPSSGIAGHQAGISQGVMRTGWLQRTSHWYFLNPAPGTTGHRSGTSEGRMLADWHNISGTYFFLNPLSGQANHNSGRPAGAMFSNGIFTINGVAQQFNASGHWLGRANNVAAVTITGQPQSISRTVGQTATFTVSATGTGLTYRWYWRNASGVFQPVIAHGGASGINSPTLTQTGVTTGMNGWTYRVVVTDSQGRTVTSNQVTLTVTSGTGGGNDFYAGLNWFYPLRNTASRHISCGFRISGGGYCENHHGIDIIRENGNIRDERVYSDHSGEVVHSTFRAGTGPGEWIIILADDRSTNGNRLVSRYIHLNTRAVSANSRGARGEFIGTVGNTAAESTSPNAHLHFDVNRYDYRNADLRPYRAMNPQRFFPLINFTGQINNAWMTN